MVNYITEIHPSGRYVKLARDIKSYSIDELESTTEEEYLLYKKMRTMVSVNYARMMRGQPFYTEQELIDNTIMNFDDSIR